MPSLKFATVDGVPYFACMVASRTLIGDHTLYDAQVVLSAFGREGEQQDIDSVMLHRGMNRFVSIGNEYEVERY